MQRLLLKKYVNESFLLFLACALMLFAFCWARVWIICQFDLEQFAPMLKQFKAFERFSPVPLEQFLTYAGSTAMTFNEPVLILCVVVWSISRGSDVVSGEIGRGTMEMLLSQPITRARLLFTHAVVCSFGLALLCFVAWLGIYLGIHTNTIKETLTPSVNLKIPFLPIQVPVPLGASKEVQISLAERVPPSLYWAPTLNLFGFGFFLLSLSSMLSCFDRYRWRTIGIVIGAYVIQLLLYLLSRATDWTGFCSNLTFFSLYQPDGMVQLARNEPTKAFEIFSSVSIPGWENWLGPVGMTGLLISFGLTFYLIGFLRLKSRDLPAPL